MFDNEKLLSRVIKGNRHEVTVLDGKVSSTCPKLKSSSCSEVIQKDKYNRV